KQVLEPLPLEPLLELLEPPVEPPELESPIWEWSRPTLVAPSISSRAATKEATASWPGAQPESSSAGPLTPLRRPVPASLLEPPDCWSWTSGDAVPVTLVSVTSLGSTRDSSCRTRDQSKRD